MDILKRNKNNDTYQLIYNYLIDENKQQNPLYKGNPRIKPRFFVNAIFDNYFLGKKVDDIDLSYTKASSKKDVGDTHCQNMAWIKNRFKLNKSSTKLKNTINSQFSNIEFKRFLIIYINEVIQKNELLEGSKVLEQWVLDEWKEYLNTIDYDEHINENIKLVPSDRNNNILESLNHYGDMTPEEKLELQKIQNDNSISDEKKKYLFEARKGQGKYRKKILDLHKESCMLSGINAKELLIASHIVPWVKSNNDEKIDEHNGLLLSASIDKLFDQHYISFDEKDLLVVNKEFKVRHPNYKDIMSTIGVYKKLIDRKQSLSLSEESKKYMKRHFKEVNK